MSQKESKEREAFEKAMTILFKATKPPKHQPKKRKKKGKD